jgi:hypothetical protein
LIITKEQIDELVAALRNAILTVMAEINDQWKMASGK